MRGEKDRRSTRRGAYHGNPLLEFLAFPRHSDGSNVVAAYVRDCTVFALMQRGLTLPNRMVSSRGETA